MNTCPQSYIDMDLTMEHINDEIELLDFTIGEHIERGVQMPDLLGLARIRANLSLDRTNLRNAMDREASVTEVHMNVENVDFDSEITMSGRGFISVETIK